MGVLVLSRQRDEGVVLPTLGVRVVVVDIRGEKVRLGFECDPSIPVHREEVWRAIRREQQTESEE